MGATHRWTRQVDSKVVGRSRSGSLTGWVDWFVGSWRDLTGGWGGSIGGWVRGAISPVDEVGGFMARSRQWTRCDSPMLGSVWVYQVDRCDGWIEWASFFLLSLSLFARLMSPEMVWSENKSVNQFPSQSHKTHDQLKWFYWKFYFPCATKHALRCKTISWNGFTPKQTQP